MNIKDTVQLGVLGVGAYLLYKFLSKVPKVTDPIATAIADFWIWATLPPAMTVQGNIILPDGSLAPLANATVKQSPDDQVYANYQGHFYQLYPADDNGNWPSVLVQ
jgi:hypothetical protein